MSNDHNDDHITARGVVEEVSKNMQCKVKLENGMIVSATISGKLRLNNIRILKGDSVEVELSPYDLKRGRIVYRGQRTRS